ncbi:MAG: HIRAN domain-containing protein [Prevotellaceae bacterium]|jgi:hypothetical protein|nr:HIRAN domain-containing protein [Prevotellaceae bacterium]
MINRHYDNFNIAGFTYYDGVDVFDKLSIGTELRLVPEPENRFDESAVALYYNEFKLGYIPKNKNSQISKFLNLGYADLFEVKVQQISRSANPEQQISVVVKIKNKEVAAPATQPEIAPEAAPEIKPVRRRRSRVAQTDDAAQTAPAQVAEPKRRRGRRSVQAAVQTETAQAQVAAPPTDAPTKRGRGRKAAAKPATAQAPQEKKKRGRKPRLAVATTVSVTPAVQIVPTVAPAVQVAPTVPTPPAETPQG